MKVRSNQAGSLILFVLVGGAGLGVGYGVVRSFHMGWIPALLSLLVVLLIEWLIFRSGRSSSYNSAQAWAQSQVDIALEVSNIAKAEAQALSLAASVAISQANATAQNQTTIHLPNSSVLPLQSQENTDQHQALQNHFGLWEMRDYNDIIQQVREEHHARGNGSSPEMAVGELEQESAETLWSGPDC